MASGGPSLRKRARSLAFGLDGAAEDESLSKGGHSLRKRARVDYAQEMFGDDTAHLDSKHDANTKPILGSTGRNRKKRTTLDFSGDDSDDASSAQRRRRSDKSPAATRATPGRRKSSIRKSFSSDIRDYRDYQDHPSDNEVQDTILVGVSMKDLESTPQSPESSQSIPSDAGAVQDGEGSPLPEIREVVIEEARPPHPIQAPETRAESAAPLDPQPMAETAEDKVVLQPDSFPSAPLPTCNGADQGQPSESTPDILSQTADEENHHGSPSGLLSEAKSPVTAVTIKPPTPEPEKPGLAETEEPKLPEEPTMTEKLPPPQVVITEVEPSPSPSDAKVDEISPTIIAADDQGVSSANQDLAETLATPETAENAVSPAKDEYPGRFSSPVASAPAEKPSPSPLKPDIDVAAIEETATEELPISSSAALALPKTERSRVGRLKHLDVIHEAGKASSRGHPHLSAYEDEKVLHPSAWTQMVYQDDGSQATQTPIPTPDATPQESATLESMWDGIRPLKYRDFFHLYQSETASRAEQGLPKMSMKEFRRLCVLRHKAAVDKPVEAPSKKARKPVRRELAASRATRKMNAIAAHENGVPVPTPPEETPRASPAPDSTQPTAASSPEAPEDDLEQKVGQKEIDEDVPDTIAVEDEGEDAEAEAEQEVEADAESDVDGEAEALVGGPAEPVEVVKVPKKQYEFPKIREHSYFVEALKDFKDMDTDVLYETLAACNDTLKAWQDEYRELKKITDDEENAKRRQANDKTIENWDKRQKLDEQPSWRRTFDDSFQRLPAPFEIKGVRAPAPYVDDPVLEYQRAQDRIMAQAYGFVHNNHANSIGRQRPSEQRWELDDGESEIRLRDRKQTQRAADVADESVIIEGKRARKPRILGDQSRETSRAPTPAPRQRRRRNAGVGDGGDNGEEASHARGEAALDASGRRRGRGRWKVVTASDDYPDDTASNHRALDERAHSGRRRSRIVAVPLPSGYNGNSSPQTAENGVDSAKRKRQRATKKGPSLGLDTEISASSFYGNPSPADTLPESRPSSSYSNATNNTTGTIESSYLLREKKKRNFAIENDPDLESRPKKRGRDASNGEAYAEEPPKKKPIRRRSKGDAGTASSATDVATGATRIHLATAGRPTSQTTGTAALGSPTMAPKRPPTKIKLINGHHGSSMNLSSGAASSSTKTTLKVPKAASQQASASAKDDVTEPGRKPYSEMSKSEKMSFSMRRRWARGEMQGAVEKRKHTLAKKATAKEAEQKPAKPVNKQKAAGQSSRKLVPADGSPNNVLGRRESGQYGSFPDSAAI
ncbi:hypothetical protein VTK73DRAFT_8200 [Phialemonium thermophilum]|uniref:Uncharacterized protein n=1 Tax=Phialemonium thermophilum TaxID=223376 RepID=A0ABR3WA17_9PEZI